jgi:hypothetical protein
MSVPIFFSLKKVKVKGKVKGKGKGKVIYIYISHTQSVNGPQEDLARLVTREIEK